MSQFAAVCGRNPSSLCTLILLISLATTLLHSATASIQIEVDSESTLCFGTYALVRSIITGNFDILDDEGPAESFSAKFYNPKGDVVWTSTYGSTEGTFSQEGEGRYELCFSNTGDDDYAGGDRNVGFALRTIPLNVHDPAAADGPVNSMTTKLIDSAARLQANLEDISDHQSYMRARETSHRELSEKTFARVVRWTLLEMMVLFFVAGGQVMYLRKFFEKKRML
mmetsp:Transcript_36253/g.71348  ORF Transcript_36253/g.71348 Transcript_36253/m.71348 type:complete len:225 (-) Transcript_36253:216-890(-)|eukprot:CAMPEP_0194310610 /NCGR_PEP_ID=MMETSP0171-20130528/7563_1 /TAXON_ID=218684 /ORGANISM="Corethron pennatum, Strain L29A3" /LENGTH=224 /DNA_ID=CAMNT_0039064317 /DNA_START=85 /DNA_END=759 /DNA_ORIENTATION=-